MMDGNVHMEISMGNSITWETQITIPLPADLQERMGIKP